MSWLYIGINLLYSPFHTYGCLKSYTPCPCYTGGNLPIAEDPANKAFSYKKHYHGCILRGETPCECWKYTSFDPKALLLDVLEEDSLRDEIVARKNAAYGHLLKDYVPTIPYKYLYRTNKGKRI